MNIFIYSSDNKFRSVSIGDWCFFYSIFVKHNLSELKNAIVVCFLNTAVDLVNTSLIDNINTIINEKNEDIHPILFIGNLPLIGASNDLRHLFLDSSIWFKYITLDDLIEKTDIIRNQLFWNNKIQYIKVAQEFREFQVRLSKQSYLRLDGEHASKISPFIFHSESQINSLRTKEVPDSFRNGLKWKVLLVDDYAIDPLKKRKGINNYSKKEIIENLLASTSIIIDSVYLKPGENKELVKKCICKLSSTKYDIILLDYLLGSKQNSDTIREFAHEFILILNYLIDENFHIGKEYFDKLFDATQYLDLSLGIKENIGPLGKYWIFPISSFSSAMFDKLRSQGIQLISDHWYISRGGDPVNTPELFKYELYSFMKLQVDECLFTIKDLKEFLIQNLHPNESMKSNIRLWAQKIYPVLVHKFGKTAMLNDASSFGLSARLILADTFSKFHEGYQLFGHIKHLMDCLSEGSFQDIPEMLDELHYIAIKINSEDLNNANLIDEKQNTDKLIHNIREGIVNLLY